MFQINQINIFFGNCEISIVQTHKLIMIVLFYVQAGYPYFLPGKLKITKDLTSPSWTKYKVHTPTAIPLPSFTNPCDHYYLTNPAQLHFQKPSNHSSRKPIDFPDNRQIKQFVGHQFARFPQKSENTRVLNCTYAGFQSTPFSFLKAMIVPSRL